jgi:hypothetical protein
MATREDSDDTLPSLPRLESAIKNAVEQALVSEVADEPNDDVRSFTKMFNREGDFGRTFYRYWQLKDITSKFVGADDAAFEKFLKRLRMLQDNPLIGGGESSGIKK